MARFNAGRSIRLFCAVLCIATSFSGCAGWMGREPLRVNVAGIEPIQGEGMEMRFNVELRVQNPNTSAAEYDGVSLELELNGSVFASGVSDQRGIVPRFGEALIDVPLTVPAFAAVRQLFAFADSAQAGSLPYVLRGRLSGGVIGGTRFVDQGTLSLPVGNMMGQ